jgi:hypothetical protein
MNQLILFSNVITVYCTLYPHKLALTSPATGGRSVSIVRPRTQTTENVFVCLFNHCLLCHRKHINTYVEKLYIFSLLRKELRKHPYSNKCALHRLKDLHLLEYFESNVLLKSHSTIVFHGKETAGQII